MLRNLNDTADEAQIDTDVAVVGAGIAGLLLAARLARAGVKTVVIESGDLHQGEEVHPLNVVEHVATPYGGASRGRSRGLGGTSTLWGGALIPFLPEDLGERSEFGLAAWPISYETVIAFQVDLEAIFGLVPGPYEAKLPADVATATVKEPAFLAREAKWPTFNKRNVATLLRKEIRGDSLEVWLSATVCDFELVTESGRIAAIVARGKGRSLRVAAKRFVIAAGAIETTRLLLLLERSGAHLDGSNRLGRSFQDHLSAPLAKIETNDPLRLNRLAGFRFEHGTMRSLRFELSPAARQVAGTNAGFVHIAPKPLGPTGYDAVRDLVRSLQRSRFDMRAALRAVTDAPYLAGLVFWRYGLGRLYWPRPSLYETHFVVEQTPHKENRITLSDRLDALGQPLARIDWRVRDDDVAAFRALATAFDTHWRTFFSNYGCLVWNCSPSTLTVNNIGVVSDIFHPVGTTAMGSSPREGVVGPNLEVFGVPNLYVASTSTFPAGGTSNPTMMLALLALRLADHLAAPHKRARGQK